MFSLLRNTDWLVLKEEVLKTNSTTYVVDIYVRFCKTELYHRDH